MSDACEGNDACFAQNLNATAALSDGMMHSGGNDLGGSKLGEAGTFTNDCSRESTSPFRSR